MSIVTVQDIQRDFTEFLRRVEAGESFLIARDEQMLAEVRPLPVPGAKPRPFGLCAGQFTIPLDFDRPLPEEILKEFEGTREF